MDYFYVSTTQVPNKYRVLRTKEELLAYLSTMVDEALKNDCKRFDLVIDSDLGDM